MYEVRKLEQPSRHYKVNFKDLQIPFHPLPEQKRIVAILDEAFAGITKAIANAEKNLTNARDLFETYLTVSLPRGGRVN